ncbi:MAG: porin family protein [Bacteroidota bacterium]|nr:porin family protein [Bacteroidota bacterium]MDP4228923.1 porin family protein [Bacteroidota bacterium]MDP4236401.1 porin family protein [Bacteroidota bacterium]
MRRLPLLIALHLLAIFVAASGIPGQTLYLGSTVGVNYSFFKFYPPDNAFHSPLYFIGGLQGDYHFTPKWAMKMQVLFVPKQIHKTITVSLGDIPRPYSQSYSFQFLEIPICAKLRIGNENNFRPYVFSGPSFAILLSATEKSQLDGSPEEVVNVTNELPGTDLGFIFGIGLDYVVKSGLTIFAEAAARYGFSNLEYTEGPMHARDLRLNAGILSALP